MIKFFSLTFLFLMFSCAQTPKESPVIYFGNAGTDAISKIECIWPGNIKLTLGGMNPGDSRGQSFYIKDKSEFFGDIILSWHNSADERMTKKITLTKADLPSIGDHTIYSYVQFYFTDDNVTMMTSDSVNAGGRSRMMDQVMLRNRKNYMAHHPTGQTSLIRVEQ